MTVIKTHAHNDTLFSSAGDLRIDWPHCSIPTIKDVYWMKRVTVDEGFRSQENETGVKQKSPHLLLCLSRGQKKKKGFGTLASVFTGS